MSRLCARVYVCARVCIDVYIASFTKPHVPSISILLHADSEKFEKMCTIHVYRYVCIGYTYFPANSA